MSECKFCHIPLTALNMSDIERDACHPCVVRIIDQLDVDGEDEELALLSDNDLKKISSTVFPTPMYLTSKMIQHHMAHSKKVFI